MTTLKLGMLQNGLAAEVDCDHLSALVASWTSGRTPFQASVMNKLFQRAPNVLAADMSGETVMMSVESGQYFGLTEVGSAIWDLLETPVSLDQIVEQLSQTYEISEQTCRVDAEAFLSKLISNGLAKPL